MVAPLHVPCAYGGGWGSHVSTCSKHKLPAYGEGICECDVWWGWDVSRVNVVLPSLIKSIKCITNDGHSFLFSDGYNLSDVSCQLPLICLTKPVRDAANIQHKH